MSGDESIHSTNGDDEPMQGPSVQGEDVSGSAYSEEGVAASAEEGVAASAEAGVAASAEAGVAASAEAGVAASAEARVAASPPVPTSHRAREQHSLLLHALNHSATLPRRFRRKESLVKLLRRVSSDPVLFESLRQCRDAIIRSTIKQESQRRGLVIGVTAPTEREGSTALSLLLTLSLAASSHLRIAHLDGKLNISKFRTLERVLALAKNCVTVEKGHSALLGYYNESYPNVYFLKQDNPESSLEFFSDGQFVGCLDELRQNFDFTVIDLPPILTESSSSFVLPEVDRLYLAVSAGNTRLAEVDRCVGFAEETGAEISGVIMNHQKVPRWARLFWSDYFA